MSISSMEMQVMNMVSSGEWTILEISIYRRCCNTVQRGVCSNREGFNSELEYISESWRKKWKNEYLFP